MAAEELPQVLENDYELRILRIPSVYFYGLWLWRRDDAWLIPAAPAPAALRPNSAYREAELIDRLRDLAKERALARDREG